METPLSPQIQLEQMDPEIRSYIYQVLMDFQPFTTPDTTVSVVAKDPLKLHDPNIEKYDDPEKLKSLWRIGIKLTEDNANIEEEGVHEDIYVAIRMAKDNLVKALIEIQDQAVSNQERYLQIRSALDGSQMH